MITMSSAVDRTPIVPAHPIGQLAVGPVRRAWCVGCGWTWEQPDPTMDLGEARRLEREAIHVHRVLADPPLPAGPDWVRDR